MDHVFIGRVTVLAFALPRTTMDVGIIARIEARHNPAIAPSFQGSGLFVTAQDIHDALVESGCVTIQDTQSTYRGNLVPATTAA